MITISEQCSGRVHLDCKLWIEWNLEFEWPHTHRRSRHSPSRSSIRRRWNVRNWLRVLRRRSKSWWWSITPISWNSPKCWPARPRSTWSWSGSKEANCSTIFDPRSASPRRECESTFDRLFGPYCAARQNRFLIATLNPKTSSWRPTIRSRWVTSD